MMFRSKKDEDDLKALVKQERDRVKFLSSSRGMFGPVTEKDPEFEWFPSKVGTALHYKKKVNEDYYSNLKERLDNIHKRIQLELESSKATKTANIDFGLI